MRLLIAAATCAFALAGCGTDTVNMENAEREIAAGLEEETGAPDVEVTCPEEVEAKEGDTFDCTATTGNERAKVHVTQRDDEGNLRWELQP